MSPAALDYQTIKKSYKKWEPPKINQFQFLDFIIYITDS